MTGTISAAATGSVAEPASGGTGGRMQERPMKLMGLAVAVVASVGALFIDGEFELTLFMAVAVICALACFDAALDRRLDAFWPWMLATVGILSKTVPSVVSRLSDHLGPDAERFDHVGTVLLGLCGAAVMFLVARPPAGAEERPAITAIVALTGIAGAVAGASVAFSGASGMGSVRAARILETLGWGTAAAILAGAAIAIGGSRRPPLPLIAITVGAVAVAVLAARTASGAAVDLGWWALSFVLLAAGALGTSYATLGRRSGRRATLTPTVVAVVAAVLAVQATVLSAGDNGTWGPGTVVLPLLAIGLLGLGLHLYRWGGTAEVNVDDDSATVLEMIADSNVEIDEPVIEQPTRPEPVVPAATAAASASSAFSGAIGQPRPAPSQPEPAPAQAVPAPQPSPAEPVTAARPAGAQPTQDQPAQDQPAQDQPAQDQPGQEPAAAAQPQPQQVVEEPAVVAETPAAPESVPAPVPSPAPTTTTTSTEHLAPHLVDPATGMRSVAGLQEVLIQAFGRPRQAGEVSIIMVALRNLGSVEATHGRVAATRVTAELAHRFSSRLPEAHTARFASDAFAALIDGAPLDAATLIPRCAEVLSELLEPVHVGETAIEIDVAASMAQCYANEDIAGFIGRANTGLERAVTAAEPSLVAMP